MLCSDVLWYTLLCSVGTDADARENVHVELVATEPEQRKRRLNDVEAGRGNNAALAETMVMVNKLLVEVLEGKTAEDFEEVLIRWAQVAFAADGHFTTLAGVLGSGSQTAEDYT